MDWEAMEKAAIALIVLGIIVQYQRRNRGRITS